MLNMAPSISDQRKLGPGTEYRSGAECGWTLVHDVNHNTSRGLLSTCNLVSPAGTIVPLVTPPREVSRVGGGGGGGGGTAIRDRGDYR